jgi:hypothetical protein
MGFRFRRSVKIIPGVRLNFSKSGVSTTVGPRGAKVTFGHGRVRETVGIPGTGISYTESHRVGDAHPSPVAGAPENAPPPQGVSFGRVLIAVLGVVLIIVYLLSVGMAAR